MLSSLALNAVLYRSWKRTVPWILTLIFWVNAIIPGIERCSIPFLKEDSAILTVFAWVVVCTTAPSVVSKSISLHKNASALEGIFCLFFQTFHDTKVAWSCTEWQLGQIAASKGFLHNWCKALVKIGFTPFDLHRRHINFVSIPPVSCAVLLPATYSQVLVRVRTQEVLSLKALVEWGYW